MQNLAIMLIDLVFFGAPLVFAFFVYRKLRVKYAKPMDGSSDLRPYIYTLLIASGAYIVWALLWAAAIRIFFS